MRYAMDAICDLALTVRSEGIMDGGDLIGESPLELSELFKVQAPKSGAETLIKQNRKHIGSAEQRILIASAKSGAKTIIK